MLMVTKCTLWPYLADIDRQANEMYDLLIEQMKEKEGVTEKLKEKNQFEWVQQTEYTALILCIWFLFVV